MRELTTKAKRFRDLTDVGVTVFNSRLLICGLDLVLALLLVPVGLGLMTGWVDGMNFRSVPNGCFGLLFWTQGLWSLYTAVRLILEDGSIRYSSGARRHRISAAISAVVVPFLWLAVLLDSIHHSPRVFEMGLGVFNVATIIFGLIAGILLVISWRMKNATNGQSE